MLLSIDPFGIFITIFSVMLIFVVAFVIIFVGVIKSAKNFNKINKKMTNYNLMEDSNNKVKCKYCGSYVDKNKTKCPNCTANIEIEGDK